LQKRATDLDSVFNKEYNMDYMATPSVKNEMAAYINSMKEMNKNAEGRAVMAGQTPETVVAEKEKSNQNLGDFTRKVASGADAYKERTKEIYQNRSDTLANQIFSLKQQRASQWANLMGNATNLGVAGVDAGSLDNNTTSGAGSWLNALRKPRVVPPNPGESTLAG
jgi:hypothetical protein